jgi:ABC-2 type transport system permease protein
MVTIVVAAGFISIFALLNEPNGALARTLSLIPFFAPIVMPVRYSLTSLSIAEVLTSLSITAGAMVLTAWVAGRIYRVGILMYGKKPSFRELFRWVRTG